MTTSKPPEGGGGALRAYYFDWLEKGTSILDPGRGISVPLHSLPIGDWRSAGGRPSQDVALGRSGAGIRPSFPNHRKVVDETGGYSPPASSTTLSSIDYPSWPWRLLRRRANQPPETTSPRTGTAASQGTPPSPDLAEKSTRVTLVGVGL